MQESQVAAASGGVATVTITGVPASAIMPGTIAEWYDPTPPAGWYLCDGAVHADMAGTLGTRYGASAGTVPYFEPTPVDSYTNVLGSIVASNLPGWRADSATARISHGQLTMQWQATRTGGTIDLANPNHSDQAMITIKAPYIPEFSLGGCCNNNVRSFYISGTSGNIILTAGMAGDNANQSDILRDDVFAGTLNFPIHRTNTLPKVYKIIKGVTVGE